MDPAAGGLEGVTLINMDSLRKQARTHQDNRSQSVSEAQAILAAGAQTIIDRWKVRSINPAIGAIRERYEREGLELLNKLLEKELPHLEYGEKETLSEWVRVLAKHWAVVHASGIKQIARHCCTKAVSSYLDGGGRGAGPSMTKTKIVIGTRGSELARTQTGMMAAMVGRVAGVPVETVIIKTEGDRIQDVPLHMVEGKGFFTKELEEALLDGRIDLAVHSLKDLPTESPAGLAIAAIPPREKANDLLLVREALRARGQPLAAARKGHRGNQFQAARPPD